MGKRSLAEQIAELSAPKNDFDIENSELADPFAGSDNDDANSLDLNDEVAQRQHYVAVPKSKLRREQAMVKDKKYTGQITNRKALYEDDNESASVSGSEDDISENDDGSDISDDAEQAGEAESDVSGSEDEELHNEVSENSEMSQSGSEDESDDESEEAPSNDRQREKIKQMMSTERKHIVNRLSQSAASDALKGYLILQQHKEFDALIDSRLKVQKALTSSNLLPADKKQFKKAAKTEENSQEKLAEAANACYDLLDTIGALRHALLRREKLASEAEPKLPKKRTLSDYLAHSAKQDAILAKYRSSVLTKWLAKIQNSSGSSAMNASKFKALNQSAEQQVLNNLLDMDRLVKRTKLNRRKITPIGYVEPESGAKEDGENPEEDPDVEQVPVQTQLRSLNMQELPQIFDDEDFYRVLLNDLVDKKIQSSDPTSGLQFALRGAASTKLKKNVDNKASKGRKLRFHVQEPIANFDTPRQWLKWNDDQIDEFFASLLGQKISMKEEEEERDSGEDDEDDEDVVGEDSIQLFG